MKKAIAGFLAAVFAIGAASMALAGDKDKEKEKEHKDKDHKEQKK